MTVLRTTAVLALLAGACSDDSLPFETTTLVVHTGIMWLDAVVLVGDGTRWRQPVDHIGDARFQDLQIQFPVDVTIVEPVAPYFRVFTYLAVEGPELWFPLAGPIERPPDIVGRVREIPPGTAFVEVDGTPPWSDAAVEADGSFVLHPKFGTQSLDLLATAWNGAYPDAALAIGFGHAVVGESPADIVIDVPITRTIPLTIRGAYPSSSTYRRVDLYSGPDYLGDVYRYDSIVDGEPVPSSTASLARPGITTHVEVEQDYSFGDSFANHPMPADATSIDIELMRPPDVSPASDVYKYTPVAARDFELEWRSDAAANRAEIEIVDYLIADWVIVGPPSGRWRPIALPSLPSLAGGDWFTSTTTRQVVGITRHDDSFRHPPTHEWASDEAQRFTAYTIR